MAYLKKAKKEPKQKKFLEKVQKRSFNAILH